jgi:hypothetical protein
MIVTELKNKVASLLEMPVKQAPYFTLSVFQTHSANNVSIVQNIVMHSVARVSLWLYPTALPQLPFPLNSVYGEALKHYNHSPLVTRRLGRENFCSVDGEL